MKETGVVFFIVSAILFFGSFHFLTKYKKTLVYPPKHILKQKVVVLAGLGFVFLLIGFLLM